MIRCGNSQRFRLLGALWTIVLTAGAGAAPWTPLALKQPDLGGEIGRRVALTAERNFLALDFEHDFLDPFRHRRSPDELVKRFGDNAVELGENLHAAVLLARYSSDPRVRERKEWLIRETLKTQSSSGYIGVFAEEPDGRQMFRNYSYEDAGHLVLALAEDFRICGVQASLAGARRLAEYLMQASQYRPAGVKFSTLGTSQGFLALYEVTREQRYLDFAADEPGSGLFLDPASLRTWKQELYQTRPLDYENARQLTRVLPHGLYPDSVSYTYPADRVHMYSALERAVCQLRLNRFAPVDNLLAMPARIMDGLTDSRRPAMVISGATGWHEGWNEDQDGRGPLGETCASASLLWMLDELGRLRGDLRFGDLMERVIFNTLFAAQEPAGRRLRYFTAFSGERRYFELDTYCCPGNFRRTLGLLPTYVYYQCADGVAVNGFTASSAHWSSADGTAVTLEQRTDYPNSGHIEFIVTPAQAVNFALRLRIPRWAADATVLVAGEPVAVPANAPCLEIKREWRAGDRVTLEFPMTWRWVKGVGMQTDRVALMRGPLVYGVSSQRNPQLAAIRLRDITIDPKSPGNPERDDAVRPGGTCVKVKLAKTGAAKPSADEVVFTEFTDPGIEEIYFRAPKGAGVEDELHRRARTPAPETLRFTNEEQLAP